MESPNSSSHVDPYVISIVDLDFHHDSVDGLIKIFEDHVREVHVFTTPLNIELLSDVKYNPNVVMHPYKPFSKFLFLLRNRKTLEGSDLVFINTIATNFGAYLAIRKRNNTLLRIHNINKQFVPFRSIVYPDSLRATWKFFSYGMREIVLKLFPITRVMVNRRMKYFTFPDNGLKDYVISRKYLPESRITESIPLKVFSSSTKIAAFDRELVITIIGATDPARRDYKAVVDAFKSIYEKHDFRIKLVILGKLKGQYGEWLFQELSQIQSESFTLVTYPDMVAESDFLSAVNSSHLMISPFVAETKTDIFREIYGKTKTSGSILDFIKFGVVTITPHFYNPPKEVASFIHKYEDAGHLAEKIMYFYQNPDVLNKLNEESKAFVSTNYTAGKIYQMCKDSLKYFN